MITEKAYDFYINGIKINENIFNDELSDYTIRNRIDFIDTLIDWIGEAKGTDVQLMKDDLKYLMTLEDEFIFSSISTNEYIAYSDNPDLFEETEKDILELNEVIEK